MARRLVLLDMKKEDAEALVRRLERYENGDPVEISTAALLEHARVEWVVARPTVACDCAIRYSAPGTGRRSRTRNRNKRQTEGFRKTEHFGWWVHNKCGKPTRMIVERFTANHGDTYDLVPEILGDPDRVPNDLRQFPGSH